MFLLLITRFIIHLNSNIVHGKTWYMTRENTRGIGIIDRNQLCTPRRSHVLP